MRVLSSPIETGTVTLCLPQDVQVEAFHFPVKLFQKKVWKIQRLRPDLSQLARAAVLIQDSKRPLIIAGGGTHYSEALEILTKIVNKTGIPVAETFAGKGALRFDNPQNLGAIGATGTIGAVEIAKEADLVIGMGRGIVILLQPLKLFQCPEVKFININVCELDAAKNGGLMLQGDAKVTLEELKTLLGDFEVTKGYRQMVKKLNEEWDKRVDKIYNYRHSKGLSQGEIISC